jgi:type IV pilus assembly protein PilQ
MNNLKKQYSGSKLLKVITVIMAFCAIAVAENGPENTGKKMAVAENGLKKANKQEVLTVLEKRLQKKISVDFNETPIDDVIRIIADQADVDIIKSPKVIGNVTAKLTDVPLAEALNNILASHDYDYVTSETMIRIAPKGELNEVSERLVNRVYRIVYADVTEVEKALGKFISDRGSISSNPGTSNIIVTDTESKIQAIDTFIEEIDRITPQVLVEVRIYDVTCTEGFDLGVAWNIGTNNVGSGDATVTDSTGLGINSDASLSSKTRVRGHPFAAGSFDKTNGGAIRLGFLSGAIDIDVALNILHSQVGAKLLANPRIMVLDNGTANFKIIREIPYTVQRDTSGGGQIEDTQFKEVGVELEVTPHVAKDGMLKLHVIPIFSVQVGITSPPTVDRREIDTVALVKDGQTVVLGGLRKRETSQDIYKIPLLGDIPFVGNLFRDESESVTTNELLVFITPKIIIQPILSPDEKRALKQTDTPTAKSPETRFSECDQLPVK